MKTSETSMPQPRDYGPVNWLGLWTLYKREVGRFLKVWMQTLFAPIISTLLFMTVFKLAFGARVSLAGDACTGAFCGVSFDDFLAPGLIVMAILQNAYQNSSSSLSIAKMQGSHTDFLMPPLSTLELTLAFVAGAATRGIVIAVLAGLVIHFSGPIFWVLSFGQVDIPSLARLDMVNPLIVIFFGLCSAIMLGALGTLGGIWADKFDHLAAINNFIIVPLTFLSGTFYDINALSEPFRTIAYFDPFFYLIDGFRYGFLGVSNSHIPTGILITSILTVLSCVSVYALLRSGYKLKA